MPNLVLFARPTIALHAFFCSIFCWSQRIFLLLSRVLFYLIEANVQFFSLALRFLFWFVLLDPTSGVSVLFFVGPTTNFPLAGALGWVPYCILLEPTSLPAREHPLNFGWYNQFLFRLALCARECLTRFCFARTNVQFSFSLALRARGVFFF